MAHADLLFPSRRKYSLRMGVFTSVCFLVGVGLLLAGEDGKPPAARPKITAATSPAPATRARVLASDVAPPFKAAHPVGLKPGATLTARPAGLKPGATPTQARLVENYGRLPLSFEANQGQTEPQVKFLSRGRGYALFLTGDEAVLSLRSGEFSSPPHGGIKPPLHGPSVSDQPSANRQSPIDNHQSAISSPAPSPQPLTPAVVRLRLVGANPDAELTGEDALPGKSNYFLGNDPKKWRTNVPNYAKVRYKDVWPGIDLVYYGKESGVRSQETGVRSQESEDGEGSLAGGRAQLEFDFVVAPGADPKAIRLAVDGSAVAAASSPPQGSAMGTSPLQIAANGDLVIATDAGEVRFRKPVVYQEQLTVDSRQLKASDDNGPRTKDQGRRTKDGFVNHQSSIGNRQFLDGHYLLTADNQVHFEVPSYDKSLPLIIDPVLSYSTFLGGTSEDVGWSIAVNASGEAFVTGYTYSTDFPTQSPLQPANAGDYDAFVAKFNASGTALIYSTYLGGTYQDVGWGISLDSSGNAYVTGRTVSTDFPTQSPLQPANAGYYDAFVTKLDANGSALAYSTYLGGSGFDEARTIAVDSSGSAYVTGYTYSTDFPTQSPLQPANAGGLDAFVAKLDANGSALSYSTYLGGSDYEYGLGIAVDSSGSAYVTGSTYSYSPTPFPTTPGAFDTACGTDGTCNGGYPDAFVTRLNSAGSGLTYSTYLGAGGEDRGIGIAVDSSGNAYVTGGTTSTDFPVIGAFQVFKAGGGDAFVAKLNSAGSSLIFSSYLGGSSYEVGLGIAVDSLGNAYLTGMTNSVDFPTANPLQASNAGSDDAFVTKVDASGSALVFSTYGGGADGDFGVGIAVDSAGAAYVTGLTYSYDFPTANPFQAVLAGYTDAFVAKLSGLEAPVITLTPSSLNFGDVPVGTSSTQTIVVTNIGPTAVPLTGFETTGEFTQPNLCLVVLDPGATCNVDVTFTPTMLGPQASQLIVTYDGPGSPQSAALAGRGVSLGEVGPLPTSLTFPDTVIYTESAPQTVVLTNASTAGPLGILNITTTGDFYRTSDCPSSLPIGGTCNINVFFRPYSYGPLVGELIIETDAAGSPPPVALSGNGVPPVITLSTDWLDFDEQPVGSPTSQTVTMGNVGQVTVNFTISIAGDFAQTNDCGTSLAPGVSCTLTVTFTPTVSGAREGTITITSGAPGSPHAVNLSGYGLVLIVSPLRLPFGEQPVGTTSSPLRVTVANVGPTALGISSIEVSGDFAKTDTCGTSLAAGARCAIDITFTPSGAGYRSSTLTITSEAPDGPHYVDVYGVGVVVRVSPPQLFFDPQAVGVTSLPRTVTLTNTGQTPVNITGVTASSEFAQTNNCVTLAADGGSCAIDVTFTPAAVGFRSGSLTITSDAPEGSHYVDLYGTGLVVMVSPPALYFDPRDVGSPSPPQTVTLRNTGQTAVNITGTTVTGDFAQGNDTCGTSIAAGASCTFDVTFTPTAVGPRTGAVTITSDAPDTPHMIDLNGASPIRNLPEFATYVFPANDDSSTDLVPLGFGINFFGSEYANAFVNNNGNITFDESLGTYTPFDLTSTQAVIIAPFFADVDTRGYRSGLATYGSAAVNGRPAFGVNWLNVGYFGSNVDKLNTFQLVLIDRSDVAPGDFDIELNYGKVQWETGDASDGSGGLGGNSARAGYSNGTRTPGSFFEISGSAVNGAFLDTNTETGLIYRSQGSPLLGRFLFQVRSGAVLEPGLAFSPASVHFPGNPLDRDCPAKIVTLTNTGEGPLTIESIVPSAEFSQTNNCPAALAAGASCAVSVTFHPTQLGLKEGTLTITSSAPGPERVVALSGNGTPPCGLQAPEMRKTVVRGTEATDFAISDNSPSCSPEPIELTCSLDNPALCALSPATIAPGGSSLLTVSNLRALSQNELNLRVNARSEFRTASLGLTVLLSDFAFTSAPASATVVAGETATYALALRPIHGLAGTVSLACSGAPRGATCTVSPARVTLDGMNLAHATVTVRTTARSAAPPLSPLPPMGDVGARRVVPWLVLLAALLAAMALNSRRVKEQLCATPLARRRRAYVGLAMALVMVALWAACGGGGFNTGPVGTPPGTSTLTVSGAYMTIGNAAPSTPLTQTTDLTLTVN